MPPCSAGCCGPLAPLSSSGVPERRYYRTRATAPGPVGWHMLARARQVSGRPLDFLADMRDEFGPVVQFPIPAPPTYLISDPHLVREVLQANPRTMDKDTVQYRSLRMVTGEGLLVAGDRMWREQRPVVQPAFHRDVLQRFGQDTQQAVDRLTRRWDLVPPGAPVDADDAMMRLALEVVGQHLFGADIVAAAPRLARATLDALAAVVAAARPPWVLLPGAANPALRRYRRALGQLDAATEALIRDRIATGPKQQADLLDLLLAAYPADRSDGRTAIRDQIVTFLVAGHETVASALTWAVGLIAQNGAVADAMLDPDGSARPPAVRAAVDETLRLYPPAWVISRTAHADTVLGGRAIPAGALLLISPWVVHRDPGVWPDPATFDPGRFAGRDPGAVARQGTAHGTYIPFGTGARLCIGRDMALMEAQTVLAALVARYRFEPLQPDLPQPDALVTLRPPAGLRLRISRRVSSARS